MNEGITVGGGEWKFGQGADEAAIMQMIVPLPTGGDNLFQELAAYLEKLPLGALQLFQKLLHNKSPDDFIDVNTSVQSILDSWIPRQ